MITKEYIGLLDEESVDLLLVEFNSNLVTSKKCMIENPISTDDILFNSIEEEIYESSLKAINIIESVKHKGMENNESR